MNISNFMVGEWVKIKTLHDSCLSECIRKLELSDFTKDPYEYPQNDYEPVSITPEILSKNRFVNTNYPDNDYDINEHLHLIYCFGWSTDKYDVYYDKHPMGIHINYVHELQRLLNIYKSNKQIEKV